MVIKLTERQIGRIYQVQNLSEPCEQWRLKIYLSKGQTFPKGNTWLSWRQFTEEAQELIKKTLSGKKFINVWECEDCGKRWGRPLRWHSCMGGIVGKLKNVKQIMVDIENISYQERKRLEKQAEEYEKTMVEFNHENRKSDIPLDKVNALLQKTENELNRLKSNLSQKNHDKQNLETQIQVLSGQISALQNQYSLMKELVG